MNFNNLGTLAAIGLFSTISTSHAAHGAISAEPALVQALSKTLLACAEQPYNVSTRTGNKVLGALRSHCGELIVSADRAQFQLQGRSYTVLVKDSELSDGGDLNDLYLQYDSREDEEVLIASNVLAFSDPTLSLLLISGHRAEELPQVLDASVQ